LSVVGVGGKTTLPFHCCNACGVVKRKQLENGESSKKKKDQDEPIIRNPSFGKIKGKEKRKEDPQGKSGSPKSLCRACHEAQLKPVLRTAAYFNPGLGRSENYPKRTT